MRHRSADPPILWHSERVQPYSDFPLNILIRRRSTDPPILWHSEGVQPYKPAWCPALMPLSIKSRHKNTVFLREWIFFDKIRAWEQGVLEKMDVFGQTMGMMAVIVQWKFGKKEESYLLFWPIMFWQNWRFFTKYGHDSKRFLMTNLKKMTWEHHVFERLGVFFFWKI